MFIDCLGVKETDFQIIQVGCNEKDPRPSFPLDVSRGRIQSERLTETPRSIKLASILLELIAKSIGFVRRTAGGIFILGRRLIRKFHQPMQSPKISHSTVRAITATATTIKTTMTAQNQLKHMKDKPSQSASASAVPSEDSKIKFNDSSGTCSSTVTAAVELQPLFAPQPQTLDIGEPSLDAQATEMKGPLHVQITNVSCSEKDTTDESSGCGVLTMTSTNSTSTSTTTHDSQNCSPRIINALDPTCKDAEMNGHSNGNGNAIHEKHDPLKSMLTPELEAIVPPSGSACISSIPNSEPCPTQLVHKIHVVSRGNSSTSGVHVLNSKHTEPIIKSYPGTPSVVNLSANKDANQKAAEPKGNSFDEDMNPKLPLAFTVDVSSALDQVLDELQNDKNKNTKASGSDKTYPCVLQQTSVVDMISSGSTSPAPDEASMESGNAEEASQSPSVRVKSNLLVCEANLNMIAQMTAPAKHGDVNRHESGTNGDVDQTAKTKFVSEVPGSEEATRAPMITGTAAARFESISRNNAGDNGIRSGNVNVGEPLSEGNTKIALPKPLAPPPQLAPSLKLGSSNNTSGNAATISNQLNQNQKIMVAGSASERDQDMKRNEKGMDMLADIILHAAPIPNATPASKIPNTAIESQANNDALAIDLQRAKKGIGPNMVPIGQSLSVYSAIAAKAGVATHQPMPLPSQIPTPTPTPQTVRHQEQIQPIPQPIKSVPQPAPSPPAAVPQTYVREIGKIRRFCAATGEFSDWEDLPCQTYGDTEPRRWCELNIDESIEIPLRRGGRLRVFPNFVADGRRLKVSQSMDKCTLYRQYWKEGDESSIESRVQVLLSPKTNRPHQGHSKRGRPGYKYDGVSMMAQPLSMVPPVERLGKDLAELYRLPGNEWNIGTSLVTYRTGNDHMAWNSNCDQSEVLILCIIADSQNCTRPILIRPKGHDPLQEGDEEIIVFVGQGDAYEMDGKFKFIVSSS